MQVDKAHTHLKTSENFQPFFPFPLPFPGGSGNVASSTEKKSLAGPPPAFPLALSAGVHDARRVLPSQGHGEGSQDQPPKALRHRTSLPSNRTFPSTREPAPHLPLRHSTRPGQLDSHFMSPRQCTADTKSSQHKLPQATAGNVNVQCTARVILDGWQDETMKFTGASQQRVLEGSGQYWKRIDTVHLSAIRQPPTVPDSISKSKRLVDQRQACSRYILCRIHQYEPLFGRRSRYILPTTSVQAWKCLPLVLLARVMPIVVHGSGPSIILVDLYISVG